MLQIPAIVIDRLVLPGQWTGEEAVRWWRSGSRSGRCCGSCAARTGSGWAVYRAGFQSARDPKYVVAPQRARLAERSGEQVER
jgi:hypothetical protein